MVLVREYRTRPGPTLQAAEGQDKLGEQTRGAAALARHVRNACSGHAPGTHDSRSTNARATQLSWMPMQINMPRLYIVIRLLDNLVWTEEEVHNTILQPCQIEPCATGV